MSSLFLNKLLKCRDETFLRIFLNFRENILKISLNIFMKILEPYDCIVVTSGMWGAWQELGTRRSGRRRWRRRAGSPRRYTRSDGARVPDHHHHHHHPHHHHHHHPHHHHHHHPHYPHHQILYKRLNYIIILSIQQERFHANTLSNSVIPFQTCQTFHSDI